MAANPHLAAEGVEPNSYVYTRHLSMESKAQQVLLHSLFWENIAPIFKTESQEAYHFFTVIISILNAFKELIF